MFQHPGSTFCSWWDTLGIMLLTYDLIVIPLRAFHLAESLFLSCMFWIAHVYWNLAIPMSFIRAFDDSGILVLDLKRCARNYVQKGWFLFDLALVSFDWTIIASDSSDSAGVARLSRTLRGLRFLRLLRLGRLVRLGSLIQSLQEQMSSRMANIQYSILKIVVQLMISNHIIACLWFLIGTEDHPDSTWVESQGLKDKAPYVQYYTSLHWAYAQLGVGQTQIEAVNVNERIYSIIVAFLALINFSTMVSSMTSLFASLQKMKDEEVEQFTLLRRHLADNEIDPLLSHRITNFLRHTFDLKKKALSKDVNPPILEMLSKPLQEELQLQRHSECLQESAFLGMLLRAGDYNVHRVVCDIVTCCMQHSVLALDVIFSAGSVATKSFYVADGTCLYERESLTLNTLSNVWVAEACLWTPWLHLGHLLCKDAHQRRSFLSCEKKT